MKKIIRFHVYIFLVILLISTSLIAMSCSESKTASTTTPETNTKPIKIGILMEYSGSMAFAGPLVQKGIELRLKEADYMVGGRSIQTIIEDSASDPSTALTKAKKLVEVDNVDFIIGPILTPERMAILPYLADNHVLCISLYGDPPDATKWGNELLYPTTLMMSGLPLGDYAYDDLNYRTVTSLGADYIAGHEFVDSVTDEFKVKGGEILQQQWGPLGTVDWGSYLVNLKKADCCVIWTIESDLIPLLKQYKEFGQNMPILIPEGNVIPPEAVRDNGKDYENIVGCLTYHFRLDNTTNQAFVANYQEQFGEKPREHQAQGYSVTSIFLAGIEKTNGDTSFDILKKAILGLEIETPQGPVKFDSNGVGITNRYICDIRLLTDGEWGWYTIKTFLQPRDPRL